MPQDQTERAEAAAAMHRLLAGGWVAQIIHTAAELGLADHFGEEAQGWRRSPVPPPCTRPRFHVCCVPSPPSALCTRRTTAATHSPRSARLCGPTSPARCGPGRASFWATKWSARGGHCRIPSAPATSLSATFSARISGIIDRRTQTSRLCAMTRCKVSRRASTPRSACITRLEISAACRYSRGSPYRRCRKRGRHCLRRFTCVPHVFMLATCQR